MLKEKLSGRKARHISTFLIDNKLPNAYMRLSLAGAPNLFRCRRKRMASQAMLARSNRTRTERGFQETVSTPAGREGARASHSNALGTDMPVNLPTNLLRSFVAIVDTGSMLNASSQVYVTQSALSLQIKRLEELVQQSLFTREGRRLMLTGPGEVLLDYARRVLALHDEAIEAVSVGRFAGSVRVGTVQDFAETLLSGLLSRFSNLHPDAQIYARVAGTAELQSLLERGQLDLILGYSAADDPAAIRVSSMVWYGTPAAAEQEVIPLAVLEKPCRFREAAIASLEAAGRPYRIAVETPNLSSLRAAVQAQLGVTCRTNLFLEEDSTLVASQLPALPKVGCIISRARNLEHAPAKLAQLAVEAVQELQ